MLQMRVSYKFLPDIFDRLEDFIDSLKYLSLNNNGQSSIDLKNKRYKLIQEAKRTWLNIYFSLYESEIQMKQQQYEKICKAIETEVLTSTMNDPLFVLNKIDEYMTYRTYRSKQDLSNKVYSSKHSLLKKRQQSSHAKGKIGVSPEAYLDLMNNPFNSFQWNQLSLGKT